MTDPYLTFLAAKHRALMPTGIEVPAASLPTAMKPFQSAITSWALRQGRAALFEGTGLGKTFQELAWAQEVQRETRKPVLIFTPLAVAEQTCGEARKFNIDGVEYASDQASARTPIVVTNYDRAHLFDMSKFGGVCLDEGGIIKAEDGKTRAYLTEECAVIPYRLSATATPAPNDWTEIGQQAEFLGIMRAKEMLAMYFVHDGSIRAGEGGSAWRLKRHAEQEFWRWVASWSVMIRSPADLGYDEPGYNLPPLRKHQVTVGADYQSSAGQLFPFAANTLSERLQVRRSTLKARVDAAAKFALAERMQPWLYWCNLNDEADAMVRAIPGAVQISGSDSREEKVRKMTAFSNGEINDLITKPSIAGHGLNWQHCRSMIYVGLNDSFEQVFQSTRRCWRFGQTQPVDAYMIASELEGAVVANQERKEADFERMTEAMAVHMRELTKRAVLGERITASSPEANQTMQLPQWMRA